MLLTKRRSGPTLRRIRRRRWNWPLITSLFGGAASLVVIVMPIIPGILNLSIVNKLGTEELHQTIDDSALYIIQLAGAAALVVGSVIFLSAQSSTAPISTRRFTRAITSTRSGIICFISLSVLMVYAFFLRIASQGGSIAYARHALSWDIVAAPAVVLLLAGLFFEQAALSDPYRLAFVFARAISSASIANFRFLDGGVTSRHIQRYNLDYVAADPLGSMSELYDHSVEAHDRVLMLTICDAIGGRVFGSQNRLYLPETGDSIRRNRISGHSGYHCPVTYSTRSRVRNVNRQVVAVYVMHFFVRNASNLHRRWKNPSARHPFILVTLNLLRSAIYARSHPSVTSTLAEGLSAMMLDARRCQRVATAEPYQLIPLVAADLWRNNYFESAGRLVQTYAICELAGSPEVFPSHSYALKTLAAISRDAKSRVSGNPSWIPGYSRSLWLQMLNELEVKNA